MDDPSVSVELTYWFFAHSFGFTPNQVDEMPYDRMVYLRELEQECKTREKELTK